MLCSLRRLSSGRRIIRRRAGRGLLRNAFIAYKRILDCFEMVDVVDVFISALWIFCELSPAQRIIWARITWETYFFNSLATPEDVWRLAMRSVVCEIS